LPDGDSIDNKIGQFMKWQRRLHCALEEMKMIGHSKRLLQQLRSLAIA
jgi:hypothetical protein